MSERQAHEILYRPGPRVTDGARVVDYLKWMRDLRGTDLQIWAELHEWSIEHVEDFWASIWDYFGVQDHAGYTEVLGSHEMPGAAWFAGSEVNYAEHCFGRMEDRDRLALTAYSQTRPDQAMTYADLAVQVARARSGLAKLGVERGDRVVGYLPNIPEAVAVFLATASLGAIWASCAPEFGSRSVVDRFAQIEPTVLFTVGGYGYGAAELDRRDEVEAIRAGLPTLDHVVRVPYGQFVVPDASDWDHFLGSGADPLTFEPVPFDHPLYVLFSSGTTGLPKPIVHGHGGILLEHLKQHALQLDLRPDDRLLWFTTTAWMMWNYSVSGLLQGACVVLFDGDPTYPRPDMLWELAADARATHLGVSPAFLMASRDEGIRPAEEFDLKTVRQLGVSGSPLPDDGFRWVHEQFGDDVLLNVISGGTDVCTGLVQAAPLLPVYVGAMSGPSLGVSAEAWNDAGRCLPGQVGELVVTKPMPSMPVGFWGDLDGSRYLSAYFEFFPGVWRHGDWAQFSAAGSCEIQGRSDATLNRGGVRIGTAELYAVIDELPQIRDSVVVHLEDPGNSRGELILFVVLNRGHALEDDLRQDICVAIRTNLSPRHVPDQIEVVPAIPYTRTGKKLEVPIKRILQGLKREDVVSADALVAPDDLDAFIEFARERSAEEVSPSVD